MYVKNPFFKTHVATSRHNFTLMKQQALGGTPVTTHVPYILNSGPMAAVVDQRGRGVSYCKNLLSPRFENPEDQEAESEDALDKTYYVFLPPRSYVLFILFRVHLFEVLSRLPSIMRRVESMLLNVQLKDMINYPLPAFKILEALTAASCQETFCYERAELLGDAYLKWVGKNRRTPPHELDWNSEFPVTNDRSLSVAVLDHLITRYRSLRITRSTSGRLTDLRAGCRWFNSFGLGDCKAPKVLGDILNPFFGAIFLGGSYICLLSGGYFNRFYNQWLLPNTSDASKEGASRTMPTAEGLEYKATRNGNLARVEVYIDGLRLGVLKTHKSEKGRRIRELTSVVQKRFKFPKNSVELYAEKVNNKGLCACSS
ncbi:hypothetical protein IFM89_002325 [Coptis chinensis]|uniref:RNase III domain-containing protein n=1 Tax=Coptis chinensis TaxID=261450 RepID=A0A835IIQ8_9MAGN|nr:hypothetical protein IFM89_002325 [Coptis chinensis]